MSSTSGRSLSLDRVGALSSAILVLPGVLFLIFGGYAEVTIFALCV
jgi:hypothetical protein